MKDVINILRKNGKFNNLEDYLIYGNPTTPNLVVLFEKRWVFEKAVDLFRNTKKLFICSLGIPSNKCLNSIKKIKTKKVIYLGDLDPISFLTYLTFLHLKRKPTPKDKIKIRINFAGITLPDYKRYLSNKDVLIKLPETEKIILDFVMKFKFNQLKQELKFIIERSLKLSLKH
jgi:hypothetical protein